MGLGSSEVDVGGRVIAQALVIAGMVVMRHEGRDLTFEIAEVDLPGICGERFRFYAARPSN